MAAIAKTKSVSIGTPIHIYEGTIDVGSIAAAPGSGPVEQDLTISGLVTTDIPVSFFCTDSGAKIGTGNVRVSAADTLSVIFLNIDDAAVDPAGTLNYRLVVIAG